MVSSSLRAELPRTCCSISELRSSDAPACELFMQQLEPRDILARFGALHLSIEYFLPDDHATIRRRTFAASNAAGMIVGILTLALLDAISVEIGIIVRSDLHGRGIGRALLGYAFKWAESNSMSHAIALIDHENHRMRALALAAGFHMVEQDDFCGKLIAAIPTRSPVAAIRACAGDRGEGLGFSQLEKIA